ncbi:MAG: hypothetical protein ACI4UE_05220 [Candidatus Scatovivens sp.]
MLIRHKEETGSVFDVNGRKMEFKNNSISSLTQVDLLDHAILNVAAKNNITDIKKLNVNNQFVQVQIIDELSNLGMITNASKIKSEGSKEEIKKLMKGISERIDKISIEKPDSAKEKLAQLTITEYMRNNGIDNPDDLKSREHSENIRNEILDKLIEQPEPEETKTEEEILDEKIKEVVKAAMYTCSTEEEIKEKIETQVKEIFTQYHQKETNNSDIIDITGELEERRKEYSPEKMPYSTEEENEFVDPTKHIDEIVEKQTKNVVDNIQDVIKDITKTEEEKKEKIDFIDNIINNVQTVEENKPSMTESEKEKLSSRSVIDEIIAKDARRSATKKIEKLNEELKSVDSIEITPESKYISIEQITKNISKDNDLLLAHLLAIKEQDLVAVELKVKPESSEKKKFMKIDGERFNQTYDFTGIDEIINSINDKSKRKD